MTHIANTPFSAVLCRTIWTNNPTDTFIRQGFHLEVESKNTWIPHILVALDLFDSNNLVKKNRPDLWREFEDGETINFKWGEIHLTKL